MDDSSVIAPLLDNTTHLLFEIQEIEEAPRYRHPLLRRNLRNGVQTIY